MYLFGMCKKCKNVLTYYIHTLFMSVQSQDLSKIIFRKAGTSFLIIMYNYHNTQRHIIIPTLLSTRTVIITGA